MDNQNYEEQFQNEKPKAGGNWMIPVSILIAGVLIAGAVIYSTGKRDLASKVSNGNLAAQAQPPAFGSGSEENIKPIQTNDHILGNPDAPVKLVEFSDTECPFCKRFHPTMQQVMQEYGTKGQVAWVYRHFPLDQIHSKARKEMQATECANELGGNAKFWAYVDKLFQVTPSNNQLDLSLLPQIAQDMGLDRSQFEQCLTGDSRGGKYANHIEADYQDATGSGGTGTPYSIVIAKNGKKFVISGAQPYSAVKSVIDIALQQ